MILDSLNSEGFFFNNNGTNIFKLDPVNATFAGAITAGDNIVIGSGGTYQAGNIYSDSSWGMILRAKQANPSQADFLFSDSADNHLVRFDGSYGLRIQTGGLQIGTTTVIDANRNLTSIGNITTAGSTSIQTAGTNTNMTIGTSVSGSTGLLKLISTGDIQLYQYGTSWSTNVTFKGDGNVGIGTPTPYGLTHWQKSSTVNLVATNTGADGQADTTVMSLIGQARGYSNNLSKLASIDFKTDPTTWYYGAITFNVANLDGTDTSRTPLEAMRINRLGNVGIGTTAPEKNLSIGSAGTTLVQAAVHANSTVGFEIKKTNATTQTWRIVDGQTVNGVLEFYDAASSATRLCAIDQVMAMLVSEKPLPMVNYISKAVQQQAMHLISYLRTRKEVKYLLSVVVQQV